MNPESHSAIWFPEPPLHAAQESTAQTALPKKGYSFLAQKIHFMLMSFGNREQCLCRLPWSLPCVSLPRKETDYVRVEECVNSARTRLALMTKCRLLFFPRHVRFVTGHTKQESSFSPRLASKHVDLGRKKQLFAFWLICYHILQCKKNRDLY